MQKWKQKNREMEIVKLILEKIIRGGYFPLAVGPLRGMKMVPGGATLNFFE